MGSKGPIINLFYPILHTQDTQNNIHSFFHYDDWKLLKAFLHVLLPTFSLCLCDCTRPALLDLVAVTAIVSLLLPTLVLEGPLHFMLTIIRSVGVFLAFRLYETRFLVGSSGRTHRNNVFRDLTCWLGSVCVFYTGRAVLLNTLSPLHMNEFCSESVFVSAICS